MVVGGAAEVEAEEVVAVAVAVVEVVEGAEEVEQRPQ